MVHNLKNDPATYGLVPMNLAMAVQLLRGVAGVGLSSHLQQRIISSRRTI
jgi:hypothetical protein